MKKMVAVGLVGLAVGLVMPGVFAQTPQAEVQKWSSFARLLRSSGKVPQTLSKLRTLGSRLTGRTVIS